MVGDLFDITAIYGDFDGSEYYEYSSERFITGFTEEIEMISLMK